MQEEIVQITKIFIESLVQKYSSSDLNIEVPESLRGGYIPFRLISDMAKVKVSKYIKFPSSKKEIHKNFSIILKILENDEFDVSKFDLKELTNGSITAIYDLILKSSIFYLTGKHKNYKGFLEREITKQLKNKNFHFNIPNSKENIISYIQSIVHSDNDNLKDLLLDLKNNKILKFHISDEVSKTINSILPTDEDILLLFLSLVYNYGKHQDKTSQSSKSNSFMNKEEMKLEKIKEEKEKLMADLERNKVKIEHSKDKALKNIRKLENSISNLLKEVNEAKMTDNNRKSSIQLENCFWMSFVIDTSLKKGGNLASIAVNVIGPLMPIHLIPGSKNKPGPRVKKESVLTVKDLNNGKYLILHSFLKPGFYSVEITLCGREISISPLYVFVGHDKGRWLRISGNSASEIDSAELDTGKIILNPEKLQAHREAMKSVVANNFKNILGKDLVARNKIIERIVSEESKELDGQLKLTKHIKNSFSHIKEMSIELESHKVEVEDLEDCMNEMFENKKKIFVEVFKKVIASGFMLETVPSSRLFSPKKVKVKIEGFETGFHKISIDGIVHDYNTTKSKCSYNEKEKFIILELEGKINKLKALDETVERYFYKGLKLLLSK